MRMSGRPVLRSRVCTADAKKRKPQALCQWSAAIQRSSCNTARARIRTPCRSDPQSAMNSCAAHGHRYSCHGHYRLSELVLYMITDGMGLQHVSVCSQCHAASCLSDKGDNRCVQVCQRMNLDSREYIILWLSDGCSYEAPHRAVPPCSACRASHRPQEEGARARALGRRSAE